jgi:hypothetical protein
MAAATIDSHLQLSISVIDMGRQAILNFHTITKHGLPPSPPAKLVKMTIRVIALVFSLRILYYCSTRTKSFPYH